MSEEDRRLFSPRPTTPVNRTPDIPFTPIQDNRSHPIVTPDPEPSERTPSESPTFSDFESVISLMSTNNPISEDDAFAHLLDNVLRLDPTAPVRDFLRDQGITNSTLLIGTMEYRDLYCNHGVTTPASNLPLAQQLTIRQLFAACHLWRDDDIQNRPTPTPPASCLLYTSPSPRDA